MVSQQRYCYYVLRYLCRYTSKRDIHTFVNEIPFGLVPTSDVKRSSSPLVEVADWRDASRLVLDTTYDHFREAPSSVGDHLLGWMTGDIQKGVQSTEQARKSTFSAFVFQSMFLLRLPYLNVLDIRSFFNSNFILPQMLVNGTALTAIGELTLSASGDGLKMSAPSDGRSYFLTKSTYASLLKEIESEAKFLKRLLAVRARHLRNCLQQRRVLPQRIVSRFWIMHRNLAALSTLQCHY